MVGRHQEIWGRIRQRLWELLGGIVAVGDPGPYRVPAAYRTFVVYSTVVGDLVSVITPVFNASETLRRAHQSLRGQLYASWEHILVDDASTDDTPRILEELSQDPRVKAVSLAANGGTGKALNEGLAWAKGEYIAFLDADDEYYPDHLGSHVAVLQERPEVDLLWGGVDVVARRYEDTLVPDVGRGVGLISVSECIVQGTIFGRRRVFLEHRFSEDRTVWWQDYEFVKRVEADFRVERFRGRTYRYYRDSGQSLVDKVKANWAHQDS